MSAMKPEIKVIADNGGGLTLQVIKGSRKYQHTFDRAVDCADAIKAAERGDSFAGWDGDESSDWLAPTRDEISNGGYRVIDVGSDCDVGFGAASDELIELCK